MSATTLPEDPNIITPYSNHALGEYRPHSCLSELLEKYHQWQKTPEFKELELMKSMSSFTGGGSPDMFGKFMLWLEEWETHGT